MDDVFGIHLAFVVDEWLALRQTLTIKCVLLVCMRRDSCSPRPLLRACCTSVCERGEHWTYEMLVLLRTLHSCIPFIL